MRRRVARVTILMSVLRMSRVACVVVVAFLLQMAVLNNAGAAARKGGRVHPPRITFEADASKGYSVLGSIWHRRIRVSLIRGLSGVEYSGPARLRAGLVTAHLGRRLDLKMKFVSMNCPMSGPAGRHCDGPGAARGSGALVGSISVLGEHDFTAFEGVRVPAQRRSSAVNLSKPPSHDHEAEVAIPRVLARLDKTTQSGRAILRFSGFRGPAGQELSLTTAEDEERLQDFNVQRMLTVGGGRGSFLLSGAQMMKLSLSPPSPFTGLITVVGGRAGRLVARGYLSVRLPGGVVADFDAKRCSLRVRWPHSWPDARKWDPHHYG